MWLISVKIVQSLLSFFVAIFTARYLGPSNYGTISYVASLVAFVTPIMTLGFGSTLVQELISNPDKEGEILGTALRLNIFTAICCIIGLQCFVRISSPKEPDLYIVCFLYSLMLLAQAFEMVHYWFQAKLQSKYVAVTGLAAYSIITAYKIFLLVTEKSVHWFAASNTLDYIILAIVLLIIYHKKCAQKYSFSRIRAKKMIAVSKYYIVSNMMITIFAQTDRIMLKNMINDAETGYYAAAVAIAGITNFIFAAIIDSMRPIIFSEKDKNNEQYELNIKRLYAIIIYLALIQSLVITIFAELIVYIIYGVQYIAAAGVLRILVWYTTFSYIGSVRNIWILAEKKQYLLWKINLSGAVCNVLINLILIPIWGAAGAAVASLITQIFTNVIIGFIVKEIRYNNYLMCESLKPEYLIYMIRKTVKR